MGQKRKNHLRENVIIMARNGDRMSYKLCLAMIHTKHPDGTPALMKLVKDDEIIDLAGGEEFMTFYAPFEMIGDGRPSTPTCGCGSIMIRNGAQFKCLNCGKTIGEAGNG